MTALTLITPPIEPPVSLAEAKAHLRVDHDEEDALILMLVNAATQHLDGWHGSLRQALVAQGWRLTLDEFPSTGIYIPLGPLLSVEALRYDDADGFEQTIAAEDYTVDLASPDGWIVLNTGSAWPATLDAINAVRIDFTAGYGPPAAVPQVLKAAVLLIVGDLYEYREGKVNSNIIINPTVESLISLHRRQYC
jgi:uncharacterized phiE125 gp8 family phage protein